MSTTGKSRIDPAGSRNSRIGIPPFVHRPPDSEVGPVGKERNMAFYIQVHGPVQRPRNQPSGKVITGQFHMEMVIDRSIVHFRYLECVGPEIARGDERLLAQVRLNNRDAGIQRPADQYKEENKTAFHRKNVSVERDAFDSQAQGPGGDLGLGDLTDLLAHQGGANRGFQRNHASLEVHLMGADDLESHAGICR